MNMRQRMTRVVLAAATVLSGTAVLSPGTAAAQDLSDEWKFRAFIYLWGADMKIKATLPRGNVVDTTIKFHTVLENLNMAGMGTLEAQKGRWGAFTDVIYMNIGGVKTNTRDGTIDGVELPVGVTSNTGLELKAWVWTLAGSYRVQSSPDAEMDVFAGARLLWVQPRLTYNLSADVGPFVGPGRGGARQVTAQDWDGIVGVKGRAGFGENREWFIPYYVDIGTGNSDLTWQISAGIGYKFGWGDVIATWRYLDYNLKSSSKVSDISMNGPLLGVVFNWKPAAIIAHSIRRPSC